MVTSPGTSPSDSDAEPLWPAAPPRADVSPFSSVSPRVSQGAAAVLPHDLATKGKALADALLEDGAVEEAFLSFAQDAYNRPDSLAMADKFLVDLFAGDLGLLARLTRIADLALALRHRVGEVCRVVVARWSETGELHQLTKLADAMLPQPHHFANGMAAEIMLMLAASLALQKQRRATELLSIAKDHIRHPQHTTLVREAERWVDAGNIVTKLPANDRALWITRLRSAHLTWTWDSAEESATLEQLSTVLSPQSPSAALFYDILPRLDKPIANAAPATSVSAPPPEPIIERAYPPSSSFHSLVFFCCGVACALGVVGLIEYFDSGTIHDLLHHLVSQVFSL